MESLKIGIIGGTGLNKVDILKDTYELDVDTVFGKPSDKLLCGKINNVDCVLLSRHDKEHLTSPTKVNYRANLLALKNVGCTVVIVTTACGSLDESYAPGDLVILDDYIDRTTKREHSFYDGTQPEHFNKICHIPMYPAFSPELRSILIEVCDEKKLNFHKTGTMITIEGPKFSSRAESKMLKSFGGHTINMTTSPEVYLAKELGMPYASIGIVTDYDCWRDHADDSEHVDVESVLKMFKSNLDKVIDLILDTIPRIQAKDWKPILEANEKLVKSSIL